MATKVINPAEVKKIIDENKERRQEFEKNRIKTIRITNDAIDKNGDE